MEFAEEKAMPCSASFLPISLSVNIVLTPVCASSKLPFIAQTATFEPSCVVIWSFCMGLTPSSG